MFEKERCAAENDGRSRETFSRFEIQITTHCPPGLKPGTLVKLIHFDAGYWIVQANGEHFTVFQTAVDAGYEYEWRGRWSPADDPRVVALRGRDSLKDSWAYSCVAGGCVNPPV